jgi:RNA recognition motif
MRLWIGNMAPGTSDDEIRALLGKYAPGLECTGIVRVEGDGSRPAAMMEFASAQPVTLDKIAHRLNGMFWKGRTLACSAMPG